MGFGERAIAAVNWQDLEILGGTAVPPRISADDLPAALLALFRSTTDAEAWQAWWRFENKVFADNTIYGAAEATVNVLMAALADDRPRLVKVWIIELLFFLLNGGSDDDPTLAERCREQARQGLWLLAQEARVASELDRDRVLDVIECIDLQRADFVRAALTSSL